jgi:hypothetical protein
MPGRMPTNMFCSGQPLRLLGWRRWGSDLGSTGKRERRGTCGADHTSQARRETILRGMPGARAAPGDGVLAGDLVRGHCCGDFATERHFAKHLLLMVGR